MQISNIHEIDSIMNVAGSIVEAVDPQKIILFGSFAKGTDTSNSDYDLCVINDDIDFDDFDNQYYAIRNAIRKITDKPVNLIIKTKQKFDRNKNCRAYVDYYIDKEGVTIYERLFERIERT